MQRYVLEGRECEVLSTPLDAFAVDIGAGDRAAVSVEVPCHAPTAATPVEDTPERTKSPAERPLESLVQLDISRESFDQESALRLARNDTLALCGVRHRESVQRGRKVVIVLALIERLQRGRRDEFERQRL